MIRLLQGGTTEPWLALIDVLAEESENNHYHAHVEHFPLEKSLLIVVRDELAEMASDMVLVES